MGVPLAAEGYSPQVTSYLSVNIPNVRPKSLVQIGICGWQALRPGVKVVRERETTTMTVTDCVEMGIGAAVNRALDVAWDVADAVWRSFRPFKTRPSCRGLIGQIRADSSLEKFSSLSN